jgi:hypothetical protein
MPAPLCHRGFSQEIRTVLMSGAEVVYDLESVYRVSTVRRVEP